MKKNRALILIFTALCLTAAAAVAARGFRKRQTASNNAHKRLLEQASLTQDMIRRAMPLTESDPEEAAAEGMAGEAAERLYAEMESETEEEMPRRILFAGDSRTEGMGRAMRSRGSDDCIYIARSGEGYQWFSEDGLPLLERRIRQNPSAPVVFNFGVNDMENIDLYLALYHKLEADYPDTPFWYLSVNPVKEDLEDIQLLVSNEDIAQFNRVLRSEFPGRYLDSNSLLKKKGFESVDGLHYSDDTYCMIHDFVEEALFGEV